MEPLDVRRRRLSSSPLCRGLNESELDEMLAIIEDVVVPGGGYVFKQGDIADGLFFIGRGRVEVTRDGQLLATLGIGEVLGELSVLGGGYKRSASAKALSEVVAARVSMKAFRKLLEEWNVAAMKITVNLAHQLTERMVALNEKVLEATKKKDAVTPTLHPWKL
jgi:CRP/FNR family transcriptional regulator, cyclic AMP receptor protein